MLLLFFCFYFFYHFCIHMPSFLLCLYPLAKKKKKKKKNASIFASNSQQLPHRLNSQKKQNVSPQTKDLRNHFKNRLKGNEAAKQELIRILQHLVVKQVVILFHFFQPKKKHTHIYMYDKKGRVNPRISPVSR
jgi:hypothetical protein